MSVSRWGRFQTLLAICLLAAVALAARPAQAVEGAGVQNRLKASWSPSRDEALVVEGDPGSTGGSLGLPSALDPAVLSRRPKGLSRPAPVRYRTATTQLAPTTETLPAPGGMPYQTYRTPAESLLPDPGNGLFGPGEGDDYYPGHPGEGCPECCDAGCWPLGGCCTIPPITLPPIPLHNLEFFAGVQGYTGPANRGGSGSFGFHEGFNWGIPIGSCLATQWGVNWTQSNNNGSFFTNDDRNQIFLTGGLFRRADFGLQGGFALDYLHEEWDYQADLLQLRGEFSWLFCDCNEIGVWFTSGLNDSDDLRFAQPFVSGSTISLRTTNAALAVNDLFAFFYRRQFCSGGQGRVFAGFTGNSQGLIGGEYWLPLNPCWSVRSGFLYVIPGGDSSQSRNFIEETWNVGISLVWTPCPRSLCNSNYSRPLFNVADNGTFATRVVSGSAN